MKLDKKSMIYVASAAIEKNMDYEDLKYSDYMYGEEDKTEEVWEYVEEAQEIGRAAFRKKYSEVKLFPGF